MKHAIVTGGAGGLGAAISTHAASLGYKVGVFDFDQAAAQKVADEIDGAKAIACDVTDPASIRAALEAFGETPDLLVNNAGIVRFGSLLEQTPDDFSAVVNVNLIGAYNVSREIAPQMEQKGGGTIINITSINGRSPATGSGAYAAAKAGLAMLTQQMSIEWGPLGIRVNAVAPGFIDSGMSAPIYANAKVRKSRSETVPLKRLGLAEDIAKAVMFLASDEANYISGHNLIVDGGVTNSVLAQLPRD